MSLRSTVAGQRLPGQLDSKLPRKGKAVLAFPGQIKGLFVTILTVLFPKLFQLEKTESVLRGELTQNKGH